MANTKQSAKRARQTDRRTDRNVRNRSSAKSALKNAFAAVQAGDLAQLKAAYNDAVKMLSKAGSKGALPKARAARKISRLTKLVKSKLPAALNPSSK